MLLIFLIFLPYSPFTILYSNHYIILFKVLVYKYISLIIYINRLQTVTSKIGVTMFFSKCNSFIFVLFSWVYLELFHHHHPQINLRMIIMFVQGLSTAHSTKSIGLRLFCHTTKKLWVLDEVKVSCARE